MKSEIVLRLLRELPSEAGEAIAAAVFGEICLAHRPPDCPPSGPASALAGRRQQQPASVPRQCTASSVCTSAPGFHALEVPKRLLVGIKLVGVTLVKGAAVPPKGERKITLQVSGAARGNAGAIFLRC